MAQLMPQVDAEAAHRARGQHRGQNTMPGQRLRGHKPGAEDKSRPQHRHQQVGDAAVVAVSLQRRHGGFGWVALVHAQQPVQQRRRQVEKRHRRPQRQRLASPEHERWAHGHGAGNHQRQQPRIPLAVAVGGVVVAGGLQHGPGRSVAWWGGSGEGEPCQSFCSSAFEMPDLFDQSEAGRRLLTMPPTEVLRGQVALPQNRA